MIGFPAGRDAGILPDRRDLVYEISRLITHQEERTFELGQFSFHRIDYPGYFHENDDLCYYPIALEDMLAGFIYPGENLEHFPRCHLNNGSASRVDQQGDRLQASGKM